MQRLMLSSVGSTWWVLVLVLVLVWGGGVLVVVEGGMGSHFESCLFLCLVSCTL